MRPTHLAILFIAGSVALYGCHSSQAAAKTGADTIPPPSATPATPPDPNAALRAQLSSGMFQLSATLDSIQAALKQAKAIHKVAAGSIKEAMAEVVDRIDSCGSTLADHSAEAPTDDQIKKNFAQFDEQRLKTIDDVNDTIAELKEVKGMVGGLTGDTPQLEDDITKLAGLVDQAMEDATGTLQALGGKEQMPSNVPVPTPSDVPTESPS